MEILDQIQWSYTRQCRGWQERRRKKGIFIRLVKHKVIPPEGQMAIVLFVGNKNKSRVPFDELYKTKEK